MAFGKGLFPLGAKTAPPAQGRRKSIPIGKIMSVAKCVQRLLNKYPPVCRSSHRDFQKRLTKVSLVFSLFRKAHDFVHEI